jgi:hypothetical protein
MNEIVILQSAEADWYVHFSRHGEKFDRAFLRTDKFLKFNPDMGTKTQIPGIRRLLISRTTFGIFYSLTGHRIVLSAILDLRQNLEQIEHRLRGL